MIYAFCWMSFIHGACAGVVFATIACVVAVFIDDIREGKNE